MDTKPLTSRNQASIASMIAVEIGVRAATVAATTADAVDGAIAEDAVGIVAADAEAAGTSLTRCAYESSDPEHRRHPAQMANTQ